MIVAAAIKYGNVVAFVPKPGRHHDVIRAWFEQTSMTTRGENEQGFITSEGKFVNRHLAMGIALKHNQIIKKHGHPEMLFSEDMW